MSEHKLTIKEAIGYVGKIGQCVCGWSQYGKTKADVEQSYERHCDRTVLARLDREENG